VHVKLAGNLRNGNGRTEECRNAICEFKAEVWTSQTGNGTKPNLTFASILSFTYVSFEREDILMLRMLLVYQKTGAGDLKHVSSEQGQLKSKVLFAPWKCWSPSAGDHESSSPLMHRSIKSFARGLRKQLERPDCCWLLILQQRGRKQSQTLLG
jgi:hypothetical protein